MTELKLFSFNYQKQRKFSVCKKVINQARLNGLNIFLQKLSQSVKNQCDSSCERCHYFSYSYGRQSIANGVVNPAEKITKPDLVGELNERMKTGFIMDENKDALKSKYENEMTGIHHLPGFLFESRTTNLKDVGLEDYEILPVEPLHTIAGHIKNLYQAMPFNLSKEDKKELEDAIDASFSGIDAFLYN